MRRASDEGARLTDLDSLTWEQAAARGATERIAQLLDRGEFEEETRKACARRAAIYGHYDIVALLFEHDLPTGDQFEAICIAASQDNFDAVQVLFDAGGPLDHEGGMSQTPLMCAAVRERWDILSDYLDRGADPNRGRLASGETPLICAVRADNVDVVVRLIGLGANVQAKTAYGDTVLSEARSRGLDTIDALLVAAGATMRSPDSIRKDLKRRLKALSRPSWSPKTVPGKRHPVDGDAFGGHPALQADENWPTCPFCNQQQSLAVQFNLDALPSGHPHAGLTGLVQLLFCPECDRWAPRHMLADTPLTDAAPHQRPDFCEGALQGRVQKEARSALPRTGQPSLRQRDPWPGARRHVHALRHESLGRQARRLAQLGSGQRPAKVR